MDGFKLGKIEQANQNVEEWLRNRGLSARRSKPKKKVKTVGDVVLELKHLSGKRHAKAVRALLRNKRFEELIDTEEKKTPKTSRPSENLNRCQTAEEYERTMQQCLAYEGPPPWDE